MKLSYLAFQAFAGLAIAKLERTSINQGDGYAEFNTCFAPCKSLDYDYTKLNLGLLSTSYDALCGYPPATGCLLLCSYAISGNDTAKLPKFAADMASTCGYSSYNYTESYYAEQYSNATQYYKPLSQINFSEPLYNPTIPNLTALAISYKASLAGNYNTDTGTWFSVGLCGYFLLLILIGSIYNFCRQVGFTKSLNNCKLSKLCQKFIVYPALLPNGKFVQPYGFKYLSALFPNRIQFLTDLFLFGLHVGYFCAPYRYVRPAQYTNFVAKRAGVSALSKIPLFILFAGRNNFLLYITGWSYSTFLHFHKVLAGWMFVDGLVHGVGYTIVYRGFYVQTLHNQPYFACGIAILTIAGTLLLHSFHMFRSKSYEFFVTTHILMALAFIILLWYHVKNFGWMEWPVAACCVWFFDRLVRVIRMSIFGVRTATITAIGENLIKVEVKKPSWFYHTPGTFGFIYFGGILFWENNPFTMSVQGDKICAFIRVKKGVTQRLWKTLVANNNQLTRKVCIEGPYGGMNFSKFRKYNDTLLLAGGSGAPGILEAAAEVKAGKLIWIVQNLHFVSCYQHLINNVSIAIDIYVTQEISDNRTCSLKELFSESDSDIKSTESSDKVSEKIETTSAQISIKYDKPKLNEIINFQINESSSNDVGILACGPPKMMDHIRNIVSQNITSWDKSVDFFDEYQTW